MNKVILSLILAVCILGMALIMLNERLGRRAEPAPAPLAEISFPETAASITARTMMANIGLPRPYTSASPYAFSSFAKTTPVTSAAKNASTYPFTLDWLNAAQAIMAAAVNSGIALPKPPR